MFTWIVSILYYFIIDHKTTRVSVIERDTPWGRRTKKSTMIQTVNSDLLSQLITFFPTICRVACVAPRWNLNNIESIEDIEGVHTVGNWRDNSYVYSANLIPFSYSGRISCRQKCHPLCLRFLSQDSPVGGPKWTGRRCMRDGRSRLSFRSLEDCLPSRSSLIGCSSNLESRFSPSRSRCSSSEISKLVCWTISPVPRCLAPALACSSTRLDRPLERSEQKRS